MPTLATKVQFTGNVTTAEEAVEKMGADWTANSHEIMTMDGGIHIPNAYAIVRDDNNFVLGVVGNYYTAIQNHESFAFFDTILQKNNGFYEYGYSIDGGKKLILQARIGDDVDIRPGDAVSKYITLINSFDGSLPFKAFFTARRLWCDNQLYAALRSAQNSVSLRHTKNYRPSMKDALAIMGHSINYFTQFETCAKQLAQKAVDKQMVEKFIKEAVFDGKEPKTKPNIAKGEMIEQLFNTGKGNNGSSAWDLYNAVTEWNDHYRYVGNQARSDANAVLEVSNKERAFNVAMSL